jgi:hypothetical protein
MIQVIIYYISGLYLWVAHKYVWFKNIILCLFITNLATFPKKDTWSSDNLPEPCIRKSSSVHRDFPDSLLSFITFFHLRKVKQKDKPYSVQPKIAIQNGLEAMSFLGFNIKPEKDYIKSRKTLFVNDAMHIGMAAPSQSTPYFFKNADADEMIFVHKGKGVVRTMYGNLPFKYGDYIIIPRGTVYQVDFETEDNLWLYVESFSPIFYTQKIPQ